MKRVSILLAGMFVTAGVFAQATTVTTGNGTTAVTTAAATAADTTAAPTSGVSNILGTVNQNTQTGATGNTNLVNNGASNQTVVNSGGQVVTNNNASTTYTTNTAANQTITQNQRVVTAPGVGAPGLMTGGMDVCLGSASGSITTMGFGFSGGKTTVDENCVRLKNGARLQQLGLGGAAIALALDDEKSATATKFSQPEVYLQLMRDRLEQAEAEYFVDQQLAKESKGTIRIPAELVDLRKTVHAMEIRVKLRQSRTAQLAAQQENK